MLDKPVSGAQRRILDEIKRRGPVTAVSLAEGLGLTDVAVRQHLQSLEGSGLVRSEPRPAEGRGRPSRAWTVTDAAAPLFPDRHGELTVGLMEALRETFGDEGLHKVVARRSRAQVADYRSRMPSPRSSLKARVEALADLRSAEGYVAEVRQERPGCYLLVEHHCPICEAASSCLQLCTSELEVFRETLGPGIDIERTTHILSGGERCIYRIQKR